MSIEQDLHTRSKQQCELCADKNSLEVFEVPPQTTPTVDNCILLCTHCLSQLSLDSELDSNHWRCLNDSMWSAVPAVQVTAYRQLKRLSSEDWAQGLLDMLYLDDELLTWAKSLPATENEYCIKHIDSVGNTLSAGDSVVLIKDLNVKGTSFTAKRGSVVRKISLVQDNAEHIEGRVNSQQIVILTKFVKKM